MAAQNPACSEVEPFYRPVLSESLESVSGAGGGETAGRGLQRRYAHLVEPYQEHERGDCDLLECRKELILTHLSS